MCLRKGVSQLLFKRNVLKGDLSLDVEVLNEVKVDSKVLRLGILGVVNDMSDCRLCISLEGERVGAWHGKL
jgi:hypothetical protein